MTKCSECESKNCAHCENIALRVIGRTDSAKDLYNTAISKWLYPAARRIERAPNVKNIEQYIARVDEMAERKRRLWAEGV